ncbi:MAG: peptidylprolyl isomerase [Elusimicrobiota bacterium]
MKTIFLILFLFIVSVSGCSKKEETVAYVGRKKVSVSEFKKRADEIPEAYLGFIATKGGKRQFLSGIIKEEILLLKANALNIDEKPEVARRLREARKDVLLASVIDHLQKEKIKVSDQELKDFYDKNKQEFINPQQIRVSHILLSNIETAKQIKERLERGASFEKLAREYSIDTKTAINGGDLGYISRGYMDPEFESEVFKLDSVGELSDIIKTPFGYHIAKLTGRRRGKKQTFEESKDEIRMRLKNQKFQSLMDKYKNEYNVRINYDILDKLNIGEEKNDKENNE